MANSNRILFVSGEVAPFTKKSNTGQLVRVLPQRTQEEGQYQVRIMMPRYGTISERRNRLHEVIRLSGTEITMGEKAETLKVKVASIPGIRLQVYFMDSPTYFKRKGIFAGKDGKLFADNAERALFFGRAVLETTRKLGWSPDVVHVFGWMSALVPMLLRTEYADDPIFENSKVIYTPETVAFDDSFSVERAAAVGFDASSEIVNTAFNELGAAHADLTIYPPFLAPEGGELQFSDDDNAMTQQALDYYDQMLNAVPA